MCVCVCVCVQIVGKNARMKGSGEFNKAASTAYHHLDLEERERLSLLATSDITKEITPRGVKKAGGKFFAKIKLMVCGIYLLFQ